MDLSKEFNLIDKASSTRVPLNKPSEIVIRCVVCRVADKEKFVLCAECENPFHRSCIHGQVDEMWSCGPCQFIRSARENHNSPERKICGRCFKECEEDCTSCEKCKHVFHPSCFALGAAESEFCLKCSSERNIITIDGEQTGTNDVNASNLVKKIIEKAGTSKSAHHSRSSKSSHRSRAKIVELDLQKLEEEHQLELKRICEAREKDKEYLERKYSLLRQQCEMNDKSSSVSKSSVSSQEKMKNTSSWVRNQQTKIASTSKPLDGNALPFIPNQPHQPVHKSNIDNKFPDQVQVRSGSTKERYLTKNQIESRRATKELAPYYGDPRGWPRFIGGYEFSTMECNFNNYENLMRLQHCLRGPAQIAASSLLIVPDTVPEAIETLREMFGQPRQIIHALVEDVRSAKKVKLDDPQTLYALRTAVTNLVANIKAVKMNTYLTDPFLIQDVVDKLPSDLRFQWGDRVEADGYCSLDNMNTWLQERTRVLGHTLAAIPQPVDEERKRVKSKNFVMVHSKKTGSTTSNCLRCEGECKLLEECSSFQEDSLPQKWEFVKQHRLCFRCLSLHEKPWKCPETWMCTENGCGLKHHKLLHGTPVEKSVNTINGEREGVLFKILPVKLYGEKSAVSTFAFIDEGSSVTLIDESISFKLGLKGESHPMCIYWTDKQQHVESESKVVRMEISGVNGCCPKFAITAHTMRSMKLPVQSVTASLLQRYVHLQDLPVAQYEDAIPTILIGLDNSNLCITQRVKEGNQGPIASKTRLGWVIQGNRVQATHATPSLSMANVHKCDCNLENLMKFQYSLENFGSIYPDITASYTREENEAIKALEQNTIFKNGHYETGLLWKSKNINIPDSYHMAMKRQMCLEKKLQRNPDLYEKMKTEIQKYAEKGYIRQLTDEEVSADFPRKWYLPVFPIINKNKPGKFRMVWDAAAEVAGISLNHLLLKGPDLVPLLVGILQRFREGRYGMCGDIAEMFHMVRIKDDDQQSQRFLWRASPSEKMQTYCMQVMTFGACSSPTTAQFIKNLNAKRFENEYPDAVEAILKDHYVDDFLGSKNTTQESLQLCKDITRIHEQGGFKIRNWISNCPGLVETIEPSPTNKNLEMSGGSSGKILGMWWSTEDDCFSYQLKTQNFEEVLSGKVGPTKRGILGILMRIFDPLGLLNHVLIFLKVLLQKVWRSGSTWDEQITDSRLLVEWRKWLSILPSIEKIRIHRWYFEGKSATEVDLHIFADASDEAYAVAVYLRFQTENGFRCSLVGSKSRVAPKNVVSIPRLELMAAVLAVRLAEVIKRELTVHITDETFWSDSSCVLWWIKDDAKKYKPFVAARICEIKEKSSPEKWRYVPSKDNVADMATKWKKIPDLSQNDQWYHGPHFLKSPIDMWPTNIVEQSQYIEEVHVNLNTIQLNSKVAFKVDVKRFSKWRKLVGATAYALRFLDVMLKQPNRTHQGSPLTKDELQSAELFIIRQAQEPILKQLNKGHCEDIATGYSAYKDEVGVIRLQGRIDAAPNTTEGLRRPIFLPYDDYVTFLIMDDMHRKYVHVHHKTVQNELIQTYFIPKLGVMMKKMQNKCQFCKNLHAKTAEPQMGDLPSARLQSYTKAFTYCGIDYFGPLLVAVGRKAEKRYGVLITCLVTRAIHLEVSHSLTTDSCIMAIHRFASRRGVPAEFYSDNGTNFKGAESELKTHFLAIDKKKLMSEFTTSHSSWSFNPPSSPHMGGCWERLVRTVKSILYKLMSSNRNPNDELLLTMLSQIECIVNSRPLTSVPLTHEDDAALTPNHFIFGNSSGVLPRGNFDDEGKLLRKQWMVSEQFANAFWRRFVREYLPMIARRSKWHKKQEPLKEGDIVLVIDEKNPRNWYPKGKVLSTTKSTNGQVRSVEVQTSDGIYTRPAVKIAKLDILQNEPCEEDPKDPSTGGEC